MHWSEPLIVTLLSKVWQNNTILLLLTSSIDVNHKIDTIYLNIDNNATFQH